MPGSIATMRDKTFVTQPEEVLGRNSKGKSHDEYEATDTTDEPPPNWPSDD